MQFKNKLIKKYKTNYSNDYQLLHDFSKPETVLGGFTSAQFTQSSQQP